MTTHAETHAALTELEADLRMDSGSEGRMAMPRAW